MDYVDTSILVAALTHEIATERVQVWLEDQREADLAISPWVRTEFSAALSVKMRTGAITPAQRADALVLFREMVARSFRILPIDGAHFEAAAGLADQAMLGIRAGDALHLAIALTNGATLWTLDRRMKDGAATLGIPARFV